jgi:hypothetical protein
MHISLELLLESAMYVAAFVLPPLLACLWAKLMTDVMPKSIQGQLFVNGALALMGPAILVVTEFFCWLTDRLGWTQTGSSLGFAFLGSLWTVMVFGLPYLYLRRRMKRDKATSAASEADSSRNLPL